MLHILHTDNHTSYLAVPSSSIGFVPRIFCGAFFQIESFTSENGLQYFLWHVFSESKHFFEVLISENVDLENRNFFHVSMFVSRICKY